MPLKLVPPRKGKTPNWSIRGTYLKVGVDRSTGTVRKAAAARIKRELERAIERGEYPAASPAQGAPSFLTAAVAYMKAGRSPKFIAPLIEHFAETAAKDIDQAALDTAAVALYPTATPATRNRCVYTPVSAILRHNGITRAIARPKGAKGRLVTDHLNPADAFPIIEAAYVIDPRFGLFLKFLLYTGCRIGEALAIERRTNMRLQERRIWAPTSKNDDPREIVLRQDLCDEIEAYVGENLSGRLFPFHQGGHLKHLLMRAKLASLGLPCPARRPTRWKQPANRLHFVNFHTFCHTWGTWMRRYGGLDVQGLVATKRWRDTRSAARYSHVVAREEWQRVEKLPAVPARGESVEKIRDAG